MAFLSTNSINTSLKKGKAKEHARCVQQIEKRPIKKQSAHLMIGIEE
jgi:hypothetical protein